MREEKTTSVEATVDKPTAPEGKAAMTQAKDKVKVNTLCFPMALGAIIISLGALGLAVVNSMNHYFSHRVDKAQMGSHYVAKTTFDQASAAQATWQKQTLQQLQTLDQQVAALKQDQATLAMQTQAAGMPQAAQVLALSHEVIGLIHLGLGQELDKAYLIDQLQYLQQLLLSAPDTGNLRQQVVQIAALVSKWPDLERKKALEMVAQLSRSLSTLSFQTPISLGQASRNAALAKPTSTSKLTQAWQRSVAELRNLVTIQHGNAVDAAIVTQANRAEAISDMVVRLRLLTMAIGLGQQEPVLAETKALSQQVRLYFAQTSARSDFLQQLDKLGQIAVAYPAEAKRDVMHRLFLLDQALMQQRPSAGSQS